MCQEIQYVSRYVQTMMTTMATVKSPKSHVTLAVDVGHSLPWRCPVIVEDSHSSQVHAKNGKQHGSNSKGILCRADFPQHLQSSEQCQTPQSHRDI